MDRIVIVINLIVFFCLTYGYQFNENDNLVDRPLNLTVN